MSEADRDRWNRRYAAGEYDMIPNPRLVAMLSGRLQPGMVALDLPCGAGRNAIWLARQGLAVHAWDISDTALAILRAEAEQEGLAVEARELDLDTTPLPREQFDLVVSTYFLHRPILLPMLESLKPGGLLFIDTFIDSAKRASIRPAFKLEPGEMGQIFTGMAEILHLSEDPIDGRVILLARRPATRGTEPLPPT